jgi:hypothetical protein
MSKSQYVMTEQQIEALAAERTTSVVLADGLAGTYLRALVAGAQSKLGPKRGRRPSNEVQLEAVGAISAPFYAAVLRGVVTADIALDATLEAAETTRRTRERNRRATFARTAKSTLVAWIEAGGDARGLDLASVTKGMLRAAGAAKREGGTVTSRLERAQTAILAAVAREGPEAARGHLERVIATLQAALDELPGSEHGDTTVIATQPGAVFRGHVRRVPVAPARAAA